MNHLLKGIAALGAIALLAGCAQQPTAEKEKPAAQTDPRTTDPLGSSQTPVNATPADASPRLLANATSPPPVFQTAYVEDSAESSGAAKSATFDDIKFEMKKGAKFRRRMLTDKIKGLFSKNIKIRGYILPSFRQSGITTFVLVRDNMECCFGPGAALFDCIVVQMVEGKSTEFSVRPVTVEGKFSFDKIEDPISGELRAIYHLDGVNVK